MPTRMIRDGWLESEAVNSLDASAERFFLRLILRADDFGRYHANHILLKSNLFPLREDVRSTDIPRWLAACEKAGLVRCYEADAKPFLVIPKSGQRIKDGTKSKFPAPPDIPGGSGNSQPKAEAETKAESKAKAEDAAAPLPLVVVGDDVPLPNVLLTEAFKAKWAEWLEYRRQRRLPKLLPMSVRKQWIEMADWGHDVAIEAIDTAIKKSWQGVFQPKGINGAPKSTPAETPWGKI